MMRSLLSIGKTLIILLLVGTAFYRLSLLVWSGKPVPCAEPIAYTIGTFDKRFNLSQKDFLSALAEAEKIWEKPSGRELFAYFPEKADLPVNLIYDYRQEVTEELTGIESEVKEDEVAYHALESRLSVLKAEYTQLKVAYDARVSIFNQMNATYESHVNDWNNSNRTSRGQFEQLEKQRIALENEIAQLKTLEN